MGVVLILSFRDAEGQVWVGAALPGSLRPVGFEADPIAPEDFEEAGMERLIDFKVVVDAPTDQELREPEGSSAARLEGEGETAPMPRED
jgi:hypothetical protein